MSASSHLPFPVVDAPLARRVELAQAMQNRSTTSPGGILEVAGGVALFAGAGSPLSQALALGLDGPVSPEELARVEVHLGQAGGPIQVELLPFSDPSLAALLAQRGYRVAEFQQVLLRPLDGHLPDAPLASVRPLHPGEEALWAHTLAQAFFGREDVTPQESSLILPITRAQGTTCFLAQVDGQPAGGGTVAIHDGIATLSGTGVRERFRGRGLQAALIRARMEWGIRHGCTLAATSTHVATASQRNMERMGFRIAYPKLVMVREAPGRPSP
jgi:GNAT superfamily N-acetyltransferase